MTCTRKRVVFHTCQANMLFSVTLLISLIFIVVRSDPMQSSRINSMTYFNGRGRAEQFRIFFADRQISYSDIRLTGAQFEKLKATFPWGHVPVFNISVPNSPDRVLADTAAMNVWLGKYTNMWPTNPYQEELLLSYSGASEDLRLQRNDILGYGTFNATPSAQVQFVPVLNEWIGFFERNFMNSSPNGPYLLGSFFTPVDCRVWDILNQVQTLMNLYPNIYQNYKITNAFYNAVAARPNIAKYLETRQ